MGTGPEDQPRDTWSLAKIGSKDRDDRHRGLLYQPLGAKLGCDGPEQLNRPRLISPRNTELHMSIIVEIDALHDEMSIDMRIAQSLKNRKSNPRSVRS